jgi:hypothetical protein
MNRTLRPILTLAVAFAPVLCRAASPGALQAEAIAEIERLGGKVTVEGLKSLRGLRNLRSLGLWETNMGDAGLAQLEGLRQLEWLDLCQTHVTDAGVKHLKALVNLKWLDLQSSGISEERAEELRHVLPNCDIYAGPLDPG